MDEIRLSAAGNTMAPCYYALRELGYTVKNNRSGETETWYAEKEGQKLAAMDPCMLLGLAKLIEMRGRQWRVSDEQIDEFLNRFYDVS